jgi:hypothetical protein
VLLGGGVMNLWALAAITFLLLVAVKGLSRC